ncbi:MAG: hypothetical protein ACH350_04255 [Parachlamydiaceae bacterium]
MACPVCPTAGFVGGWIGGYIGVKESENIGVKRLNTACSAILTSITIIGLKALFNLSLCIDGKFNWNNFIQVGLQALVIGVIYSIGVNYILNHSLFFDLKKNEGEINTRSSPCCCSKSSKKAEI